MITKTPRYLNNGHLSRLAEEPEPPRLLPDQSFQLSPVKSWILLGLVFLSVYFAALFSPSLLDDADATHAQAAQNIALTGDWVTLKVDGLRYLEKPPLPYWIVAADYHLFGFNVFATHLPIALGILGCAILAWIWARRAYGERAGFYAALGILTSIGTFLFTRIFIPEALLTLFTGFALYCLLTGFEDRKPARFYWMWASLALGLLTKGLIAPVFFLAAAIPYLLLTGMWRRWRELRPVTGLLLFLIIAAPWHILAGIRNPDHGHPVGNIPSAAGVHGFFYFYFVNEHILRFLGLRYPHDYYKLPWYFYWPLHLVWLAPWSLFFPIAVARAWRTRFTWLNDLRPNAAQTVDYYIEQAHLVDPASHVARVKFRARTNWLLAMYAAFILVFFAASTNQEYYTFPAYFPLLVLGAGALARAEEYPGTPPRWLMSMHYFFAGIGIACASALFYGLWASRKLPYVSDIGTLMAHRGVSDYTVSMARFFDLTGPSFAALREPSLIAACAFLAGPVIALLLRRQGHHFEATSSVAFTAAIFLIAAHIALVRFEPLLSSRAIADTINRVGKPDDQLILYGDQADGSSVIFYTGRRALLVNGRSTSMIWGSYYPDAPRVLISDEDLLRMWGTGPRKFLFVPEDAAKHVDELLGARAIPIQHLADKTLLTDRAPDW